MFSSRRAEFDSGITGMLLQLHDLGLKQVDRAVNDCIAASFLHCHYPVNYFKVILDQLLQGAL